MAKGLIKAVTISTRKGVIKLMEPTDQGKRKLRKLGIEVSRALRYGGLEHLYWMKQVRQKLERRGYSVEEEYPIGGGETVDLAIIGKKKKVAIEIETGKSDAVGNIRKCLNAGFEVVSVATNLPAYKRLKSSVKQIANQGRHRIRIGITK